ncbi:MAG: hypothetical protein ACRCYU_08185 [Nocardioides sp.]
MTTDAEPCCQSTEATDATARCVALAAQVDQLSRQLSALTSAPPRPSSVMAPLFSHPEHPDAGSMGGEPASTATR